MMKSLFVVAFLLISDGSFTKELRNKTSHANATEQAIISDYAEVTNDTKEGEDLSVPMIANPSSDTEEYSSEVRETSTNVVGRTEFIEENEVYGENNAEMEIENVSDSTDLDTLNTSLNVAEKDGASRVDENEIPTNRIEFEQQNQTKLGEPKNSPKDEKSPNLNALDVLLNETKKNDDISSDGKESPINFDGSTEFDDTEKENILNFANTTDLDALNVAEEDTGFPVDENEIPTNRTERIEFDQQNDTKFGEPKNIPKNEKSPNLNELDVLLNETKENDDIAPDEKKSSINFDGISEFDDTENESVSNFANTTDLDTSNVSLNVTERDKGFPIDGKETSTNFVGRIEFDDKNNTEMENDSDFGYATGLDKSNTFLNVVEKDDASLVGGTKPPINLAGSTEFDDTKKENISDFANTTNSETSNASVNVAEKDKGFRAGDKLEDVLNESNIAEFGWENSSLSEDDGSDSATNTTKNITLILPKEKPGEDLNKSNIAEFGSQNSSLSEGDLSDSMINTTNNVTLTLTKENAPIRVGDSNGGSENLRDVGNIDHDGEKDSNEDIDDPNDENNNDGDVDDDSKPSHVLMFVLSIPVAFMTILIIFLMIYCHWIKTKEDRDEPSDGLVTETRMFDWSIAEFPTEEVVDIALNRRTTHVLNI